MNASPDIADHPARILIVDDEPFNRQLLEVMLAPEGFHLLTAASGEEALAMVARQHPDLILLDIMMPGQVLEGEVASRTSELLLLTEREQSRRDQMRFKDEFLSHVSHELRTPLTAIKQFTSILLSGVAGELNQEQHEYQQIVLKNIQQLQSMIDDLLEVARVETAKLNIEPESVSVSEAVSDPSTRSRSPAGDRQPSHRRTRAVDISTRGRASGTRSFLKQGDFHRQAGHGDHSDR